MKYITYVAGESSSIDNVDQASEVIFLHINDVNQNQIQVLRLSQIVEDYAGLPDSDSVKMFHDLQNKYFNKIMQSITIEELMSQRD